MPQAPRTLKYRRAQRPPERRPSSAKRGYNRRWQKFRLAYLQQEFSRGNVQCAACRTLLDGESRGAHVDHRTPHCGNHDLMYDENNLQILCPSCHSAKTVREDGGFGRGKTGR